MFNPFQSILQISTNVATPIQINKEFVFVNLV